MASESTDSEVSILDLLLVVAENARQLTLIALVVGALTFGGTFLMTPTFTATTRILPPQQQQNSAAMLLTSQLSPIAAGAAANLGIKNSADLYVSMIGSRTVADTL